MGPVQLDKELAVPLYHQLKTVLLQKLRSGEWKPNQRLPTEDELGIQFGVSKATVRQSLRDLAQAGFVRREQGRGTFVADQRVQFGPRHLTSFTEEMRHVGLQTQSTVLAWDEIGASGAIADALQLKEGAPVYLLRRLRMAGGEPMGLQTVHLDASLAPGLLEFDFSSRSLYHTLEQQYHLVLDHARQRHFAVALTAEQAGLLQVPAGSPALAGERLTYLRGGRPLELTQSVMRGDRYHIQLKLVRMPER
jgi:GntR family transcriptional regulator